MNKKVPWKEIEKGYARFFSNSELGAPAKFVRIALGALIIKERLQKGTQLTNLCVADVPVSRLNIIIVVKIN